ncbi:MAG: cytochrome c3 family protein [Pyrinomonadaceae bacterium]
MKSRLPIILVVTLGVVALTIAYNPAFSRSNSGVMLDGTNPPHAVDTDGKTIPESSATQPDKPIILSKDSNDPKWGELKPETPFDHTKHNTDVTHTLDGKTLTACVYCHHTDQPSASGGQAYLKRFERKEVLTAAQLESSKEPVKGCRACHFQPATEETAEFPPKSVTYPKELKKPPSGKLTNDTAYHTRCISCHEAAVTRDPKLKAPQGCADCHVKK